MFGFLCNGVRAVLFVLFGIFGAGVAGAENFQLASVPPATVSSGGGFDVTLRHSYENVGETVLLPPVNTGARWLVDPLLSGQRIEVVQTFGPFANETIELDTGGPAPELFIATATLDTVYRITAPTVTEDTDVRYRFQLATNLPKRGDILIVYVDFTVRVLAPVNAGGATQGENTGGGNTGGDNAGGENAGGGNTGGDNAGGENTGGDTTGGGNTGGDNAGGANMGGGNTGGENAGGGNTSGENAGGDNTGGGNTGGDNAGGENTGGGNTGGENAGGGNTGGGNTGGDTAGGGNTGGGNTGGDNAGGGNTGGGNTSGENAGVGNTSGENAGGDNTGGGNTGGGNTGGGNTGGENAGGGNTGGGNTGGENAGGGNTGGGNTGGDDNGSQNAGPVLPVTKQEDGAPTSAQGAVAQGLGSTRADALTREQPDLSLAFHAVPDGPMVTASSMGDGLAVSLGRGGPVWAEARGNRSVLNGVETAYLLGSAGAHWQLSQGVVLGVMVLTDRLKTEAVDGRGWLAGPYAVVRAKGQPLVLHLRYLEGGGRNRLADGTVYDSRRSLAMLGLSGSVTRGAVEIVPSLRASRGREVSDRFVDATGLTVPSQVTSLTQIEAGLAVSFPVDLGSGETRLRVGLSRIWTDGSAGLDGQRGDLSVLLRHRLAAGGEVTLQLSRDGLGMPGFKATRVAVNYALAF